jgi:hypothetical protein
VLLLAMPEPELLFSLARKLTEGLIAVLVSEEQVYEGRQLARDYDNVMFTPQEPGTGIPWRDDFFTLVYAPRSAAPAAEIARVLQPGGVLLS